MKTKKGDNAPGKRGADPVAITEMGRAKINLALHVIGCQADGLHALDSIVMFAKVGDHITARHDSRLQVEVSGRFAKEIELPPQENLIYKTAAMLQKHLGLSPNIGANFHLEKRLPVAAGLGGGSADAAAAARILSRLWPSVTGISEEEIYREAENIMPHIGADCPVCFHSLPCRMRGIGDELSPPLRLPDFHLALINPGISVLTSKVFAALSSKKNSALPPLPLQGFDDLEEFSTYIGSSRNDLEGAACRLVPEIVNLLSLLRAQKNVLHAGMSGSGATCFAICRKRSEAMRICAEIKALWPAGWAMVG